MDVEWADINVGRQLPGRLDTDVKNIDTDVTNKIWRLTLMSRPLTPKSRIHTHTWMSVVLTYLSKTCEVLRPPRMCPEPSLLPLPGPLAGPL